MKLKKFDVIIFAIICALTIAYALYGLFSEAESTLLVKIISVVPLSLLCVAKIEESFKRFKESFLSSDDGSIASAFLTLGLGAMTLLPLRISFREFFISKPLHEQLLTLFVFSFLYSVSFTFFIYPFISECYTEWKENFFTRQKMKRRSRFKHVAVVAVSGTGKGTVIKGLRYLIPELEFSVSATTRKPRGTEVNGVDYHFLPKWKFILNIALFRFVEWNRYADNRYGTLKREIRKKEKQGIPIVFDVDINGAVALKKFLGDDLITVFLNCPLEESEKRLRGRDEGVSEEYIKKRMAEGLLEVQRMEECDAIIFYGFGADPNITANTIANKMLAA